MTLHPGSHIPRGREQQPASPTSTGNRTQQPVLQLPSVAGDRPVGGGKLGLPQSRGITPGPLPATGGFAAAQRAPFSPAGQAQPAVQARPFNPAPLPNQARRPFGGARRGNSILGL